MLNAAEHVTLIKAVLSRPKPLNIQTPPFQPQSLTSVSQSQVPVSQPSTTVSQPPTAMSQSPTLTNFSVSEPSSNADTSVTNDQSSTLLEHYSLLILKGMLIHLLASPRMSAGFPSWYYPHLRVTHQWPLWCKSTSSIPSSGLIHQRTNHIWTHKKMTLY